MACRCTIKDVFETAGLRTTSGYPPFANYVPQRDAAAVALLRQAGAIILGKTNLPPLAAGGQSVNAIFGRTNNPWNLDRTPGGSSGGGAACCGCRSVAARSGQRYQRFAAHARALLRHLQPEAHRRTHSVARTSQQRQAVEGARRLGSIVSNCQSPDRWRDRSTICDWHYRCWPIRNHPRCGPLPPDRSTTSASHGPTRWTPCRSGRRSARRFNHWPIGSLDPARRLNVTPRRASDMRKRGSQPHRLWPR